MNIQAIANCACMKFILESQHIKYKINVLPLSEFWTLAYTPKYHTWSETAIMPPPPPPPPKVSGDILVSVRIQGAGVGLTVCIHHISCIIECNFTVLTRKHTWDKLKYWLIFWDFDPISNVTGDLRLLISLRRRRRDSFLYAWYLLNTWMEFHQTCMYMSLRQAQELIRT